MIALATLHPGGLEGDSLRALVVVGVGLLLAVYGVSVLRGDGGTTRSGLDRVPLIATCCVLGVAALQLVPLPSWSIGSLAPQTAELYRLDGGGAELGWRPLSIEPVATARSLLLGAAYVAAFVIGSGLGRRRALTGRVAAVLGIVGVAVTLVALAHTAEGATGTSRPTSPFLNPNHLATFLTLCLGPALGVALAPQPQTPGYRSLAQRMTSLRGLAVFSLTLIVTGLFLSMSRGGLIAAAACVVLTVMMSGVMARRAGEVVRRRRWIGLGVGVGALMIGALISNYAVVDRIEGTGEVSVRGRIEIWSVTLDVIGGRPLAGSGLGTYDGASFAALPQDHDPWTRPESAHNDYLELASDLGIPAALLALLAVLLLSLRTAKRLPALEDSQRAVTAGLLAGAVGALIHATVDFALQIPGPALMLAVSFGLSWGSTQPKGAKRSAKAGAMPLVCAIGLVVLGAMVFAQAQREAAASEAYARVQTTRIPEVRRDWATDAVPVLKAAQGEWCAGEVAYQLAHAALVQNAVDYPLALEQARQAVRRAPGRAYAQILLAYLLLDERWGEAREAGTSDEVREALQREGRRRLELAVLLGPVDAQVLLLAGELELDAFVASGEAATRDRARSLLARAVRCSPQLRRAALNIVNSRRAQLGSDAARLVEVLDEKKE